MMGKKPKQNTCKLYNRTDEAEADTQDRARDHHAGDHHADTSDTGESLERILDNPVNSLCILSRKWSATYSNISCLGRLWFQSHLLSILLASLERVLGRLLGRTRRGVSDGLSSADDAEHDEKVLGDLHGDNDEEDVLP